MGWNRPPDGNRRQLFQRDNCRSQQGRFHFVIDINEAKNPRNTKYRVLPASFVRRVCRSTLQAETYALQHGLEAGDRSDRWAEGTNTEPTAMEDDSRMCIDVHSTPRFYRLVEVLQTTLRPKFWLACRTTGLASNWWPSATMYGVTVRKLGILWRMVGTVLNGFLRLRWYQTAPRLWNRTSYWKSWKRTFTEYRSKNPNARLGP